MPCNLLQKDERERIQIQKTADTLEDLESRLEGWATEIENKVIEGTNKANAAKVDRAPDILARIDASEAKIAEKLDGLEKGVGSKIGESEFANDLSYGVNIHCMISYEKYR